MKPKLAGNLPISHWVRNCAVLDESDDARVRLRIDVRVTHATALKILALLQNEKLSLDMHTKRGKRPR